MDPLETLRPPPVDVGDGDATPLRQDVRSADMARVHPDLPSTPSARLRHLRACDARAFATLRRRDGPSFRPPALPSPVAPSSPSPVAPPVEVAPSPPPPGPEPAWWQRPPWVPWRRLASLVEWAVARLWPSGWCLWLADRAAAAPLRPASWSSSE